MKQLIYSKWDLIRIIRLLAGLAILIQAVLAKDIVFGMIGLLFAGMALFNVGCCGTNGCYTPIQKSSEKIKDIGYEEVD